MSDATSRHGKPRSAFERRLDRFLGTPTRRYGFAVLAGVVPVSLIAGLVLALTGGGEAAAQRDRAAGPAASASASASALAEELASGAPEADPGAEKVLRDDEPKHFREVRWSGDFLRVYTDLKEGDTDHPAARSLCETAVKYLKDVYGDDEPVVFVHAKENSNGHVVLVNSTDGRCRPVETR